MGKKGTSAHKKARYQVYASSHRREHNKARKIFKAIKRMAPGMRTHQANHVIEHMAQNAKRGNPSTVIRILKERLADVGIKVSA